MKYIPPKIYNKKIYQSKTWLEYRYIYKNQNCREISQLIGSSEATIWRYLNKFNLNLGRHEKKKQRTGSKINDSQWLQNQIAKKLNCPQIADILGCSVQTVYSRMHEFQIPLTSGNKGQNHPNWKGGITPLRPKISNTSNYSEWREFVFSRDQYTCRWCGIVGGDLHADHIKPFSWLLEDHNICSVEEAMACSELWDIDNGRTLCATCHSKTPTYLSGAITRVSLKELQKLEIDIITEIQEDGSSSK